MTSSLGIQPQVVCPTGLDLSNLDTDACRAVRRLQDRGYEAYLVGGCVRDLLLARAPKDFDIATSARPQHVKRTFPRNCRIIGRRFKLAHLHFNQNRKILEVSTFRRRPEEQEEEDGDLLITADNEFGTSEEDALRRDFTVNGMFFDPVRDCIIDYTGGLADIEARLIRTIGDPSVRFREDPVRILRAAKFAGRLGFGFDPATFDAMAEAAEDLNRAAPPRVLEEILRLLRGGHALDSFQILRDIGALRVVLPEVDDYLTAADYDERRVFWRMLDALDAYVARTGSAPSGGLILGALFARPVLAATESHPSLSPTTVAEEVVQPFALRLRLPRRETGCLKRICGVQHRFTSKGRRRFRMSAFLADPFFGEALELFGWTCAASGRHLDEWSEWQEHSRSPARAPAEDAPPRDASSPKPAPAKKAKKGDGGKKSERAKKGKKDKDRDKKRGKSGAAEGKDKRRKDKKPKKDSGSRKPVKIATIEPEPIDLSAFDVELDPKRVPTFGTIVEEGRRAKKRRLPVDDDEYKPPPPPGSSGGGTPDGDSSSPPPPPPADSGGGDTFGDW